MGFNLGKLLGGVGGQVLGLGLGALGLGQAQGSVRGANRDIERIMSEIAALNAKEESDFANNSRLILSQFGGDLGSALESTGRGLGSALAGAGVYNSSAAAGALSNLASENSAVLGRTSRELGSELGRMRSSNMRSLMGSRLGVAGDRLSQAQADVSGARGGLASALGSMVQNNLRGRGIADVGRSTGLPGPGKGVGVDGGPTGQHSDYLMPPLTGKFGLGPFGRPIEMWAERLRKSIPTWRPKMTLGMGSRLSLSGG